VGCREDLDVLEKSEDPVDSRLILQPTLVLTHCVRFNNRNGEYYRQTQLY
jgi:hypothetical protein